MKYINRYSEFENTNEGVRTWLSTFLLLANMGLVPLSVKTANAQSKKEFIENQPDEKIDAVKFVQFLNRNGFSRPIEEVWTDFTKQDSTVTSNLDDVKTYINRDGKVYRIDQKYKIQDFSNVDINKFSPENWLTDMGSFIPDSLEPRINNFISDYEQKTSIEIGIITVDSLGDVDIFDYSQEQFDRLGVGKKGADNGILIVFSMKDRKSRIHTGYGIEGLLTDAQCRRLLDNVVKPNFKEAKYFDGTMMLLQSIREDLGDEAFEERQKWLKQKKEQEEKEWQELKDDFYEFIFYMLLVAAILGPIGYSIYKIRKNKKTIEAISATIKEIKNLKENAPKSTEIFSNYLISELNKMKSTLESIDTNDLSDAKNNTDKLNVLKKYEDLAKNSIRKYMNAKKNVSEIISDISNIDKKISNAYSTIETALIAYQKIKGFGYTIDEPSKRQDYDKITHLASESKSLLSDNIDNAILKYKKFITDSESVLFKSKSAISMLGNIETAMRKVNNSNQMIDSSLNDMNRYKRWGRSDEKREIELSVSNYLKILGTSKDYLKLVKLLDSLLSEIDNIRRKWKRRKEEEEEEEERRRRRAAESSYSSSSSSSSSSSWGGFGGGSSGGGGASSGW